MRKGETDQRIIYVCVDRMGRGTRDLLYCENFEWGRIVNVLKYSKLIGKQAKYAVKDMVFDVEIINIEDAGWQRVSFYIKPISGTGCMKVLETSLKF